MVDDGVVLAAERDRIVFQVVFNEVMKHFGQQVLVYVLANAELAARQ
ncbi:hypothetical protein AB4Y38_09685 [Paraburkholderia sp. EG285A]